MIRRVLRHRTALLAGGLLVLTLADPAILRRGRTDLAARLAGLMPRPGGEAVLAGPMPGEAAGSGGGPRESGGRVLALRETDGMLIMAPGHRGGLRRGQHVTAAGRYIGVIVEVTEHLALVAPFTARGRMTPVAGDGSPAVKAFVRGLGGRAVVDLLPRPRPLPPGMRLRTAPEGDAPAGLDVGRIAADGLAVDPPGPVPDGVTVVGADPGPRGEELFDFVEATVLLRPDGPAFARDLLLERGVDPVVRDGSLVLAAGGLLGFIAESGRGWARVRLAAAPGSSVDAEDAGEAPGAPRRRTIRGVGAGEFRFEAGAQVESPEFLRTAVPVLRAGARTLHPAGIPLAWRAEADRPGRSRSFIAKTGCRVEIVRFRWDGELAHLLGTGSF